MHTCNNTTEMTQCRSGTCNKKQRTHNVGQVLVTKKAKNISCVELMGMHSEIKARALNATLL